MKKLGVFLMALVVSGIFILGCASQTDKEVKTVVYENLRTANEEDLDGYMATIHESSPAYGVTRKLMEQFFQMYDLKYEITSFKVVNKSEDTAEVEVTQITKKINGPQFRDNKIVAIHVLKKSGDDWKIFESKYKKVEYLD